MDHKITKNGNTNARKRTVIGITGGIAGGKTVATDALCAAGFRVIDADEVSRALTAPGSACEKELCGLFPEAVTDGRLDRRALRGIIAADPAAREKLNACTHPKIFAELERLLADCGDAVLSVPLMFETGFDALCDATVCIVCPLAVRLERLMARDNVTAAEARLITETQLTDAERASRADYVISSDVPIEEFKAATVRLFKYLFSERHSV